MDERYKELLRELDRQQASLALPDPDKQAKSEATALLNVTQAQLRGMSDLECQEGAILLQQLSFHIQRRTNRCLATAKWCEETIQYLIAPEVGKMPGYSLNERRPLAVRNNDVATRFQAAKVKAETLAADIAYFAVRVENQARFFSDLAKIKVKQHG